MINKIDAVILIMFLFVAITSIQVFAQAPDTVDVPLLYNNSPIGAINNFIMGDTTAAGERNNPNRVYKLKRGENYFYSGNIENIGFPLTIIGEKEDPGNPMKPATIAPGILDDGSIPKVPFRPHDDLTFRDVFFMGQSPNNIHTWGFVSTKKDSIKLVFDKCYFDMVENDCIVVKSAYTRIFITNCFYKNGASSKGWWNGRLIHFRNNPADTLIMFNNTYVNCNSQFLQVRNNTINLCRIEHNTIYNQLVNSINWSWGTDATTSNNIFYNTNSYGENVADTEGHDWDGLIWGLVNVDTLTEEKRDQIGIQEIDRVWKVNNNCYYWDPKIVDYWNSFPDVKHSTFMNERSAAMMNDPVGYPHFEAKNNVHAQPLFTNPPTNLDSMIEWLTIKRNDATPEFSWGWDPDGDGFGVQWPVPEDFSYPTDSELYTAADGGFPVGDLNWFPEKLKEWEEWYTISTSVEKKHAVVVEEFDLYQNYPNPFNPSTTIGYSLKKDGAITLMVYNVLGQQVRVLINQAQQAGYYTAHWDGMNKNGHQLPNGIYYYQLKFDDVNITKKMVLMK